MRTTPVRPRTAALDPWASRLTFAEVTTGRPELHGWIRRAAGSAARFEACFAGAAFSSHRHDTYVFCLTVSGVQSFDYRGTTRHSPANGVVVLHPDERHDGRAGSDTPFRYRAISVAPAEVQTCLRGRPLPHLANGTSDDRRLHRALQALLQDFDRPLEPLQYDDGIYGLATALLAVCGPATDRNVRIDRRAVERARAYIDANSSRRVTMDDLEQATDCDRWQLSRDFRAAHGTSPYRYVMQRRLARARAHIEAGVPGAQAAAECGFSDQSHLVRQFRQAFGLSPKQWCKAVHNGSRAPCTIVQ